MNEREIVKPLWFRRLRSAMGDVKEVEIPCPSCNGKLVKIRDYSLGILDCECEECGRSWRTTRCVECKLPVDERGPLCYECFHSLSRSVYYGSGWVHVTLAYFEAYCKQCDNFIRELDRFMIDKRRGVIMLKVEDSKECLWKRRECSSRRMVHIKKK